MVPRNIFIAVIGATMLVWSGVSIADEYRPDEFLGLDLSRAVLSPKRLGPGAGFVPGPLDVSIAREKNGALARAEPAAGLKTVVRSTGVAQPRAEQPGSTARTKLARHHRNPLEAQAFDARIQVWPCRSGGICNWKR